ncbi:immunity-specific protein Beta371 [Corynebacterium diphtheriae 31A]|nr:immunity-specific protein Beta371 [Corynebacterium diphtheriae 31A]
MTVGRRQATYVYGSFDVRLPEGREQADVEKRLQNGYIYRPDKPAAGRFDVSFVRADATVDLTAQTSDLETQIEAAQLRTEGDIFFERDITDSGTGRYRPGIDIKRGDIVDVLIWGQILPLPITRWEMISDDTTSVGWRWHVGGAMIEDSEALRSHNDQLLQQIAQEKRQMAKSIGAVSQQAASAGTAAAKADGKAAAAQETAEDALEKWRQQKDQLDKVQSAQIEANAKANDAQQRAIDLGFLFNHGEWIMSKEWKANAGESKVMDFDTELSTPRGCESTAITSNGETVGHGIRFLSPGFWRLYARVLIPWVGLIQASAVHVSIVVMGKTGKSIAKSKYALVVDTAPSTASFPMTVEIPEAGCYAYVEVHTSKALNQSIVPGTFVNPENNEFSAQQISKIF